MLRLPDKGQELYIIVTGVNNLKCDTDNLKGCVMCSWRQNLILSCSYAQFFHPWTPQWVFTIEPPMKINEVLSLLTLLKPSLIEG